MKGAHGMMNVEFSEHYDPESDIYYVTFKTGEPSCVMEVDDVLLVEVGMFTKMPTGFRILNFAKNKVGMVALHTEKLSKRSPPLKTGLRHNSAPGGRRSNERLRRCSPNRRAGATPQRLADQ